MLLGRVVGIVLAILGVPFTIIAMSMLSGAGFTIRLFFAGPVLLLVGLAMVLLPGGPVTVEDSKQPGFDSKRFFITAPLLHKIVWGAAGLIGISIAFFMLG